MIFTKSAGWAFAVLMLAANGAYALEAASPESGQQAPKSTNSGSQSSADIEARAKLLRDAEALMNAGRPVDAYKLLEPFEFDRSGEVKFDYLIGIAALDSGKPDKATIAFERVLAVDPNFAGARLDMARAYFQLGDLPRARIEFEAVAKQNPPEAARATIQKYLDAIAAQEAVKHTQSSAYVEGGLGRDNNVNNSTSNSLISAPGLGNIVFALSPTNLKTADNYYSAATGGEVSHDLNTKWGLYAGIDARQRGNNTQTRFDTLNLDSRAGVTFKASDKNSFRFGGMGGRYNLNRVYNRNFLGLSADWKHIYSPINQSSVFVQYGRNRIVDPLVTNQDFNQAIFGTSWLHAAEEWRSLMFGSLYLVYENDTAPITATNPGGGRPDGNKSGLGMRVGEQTALGERTELFANLGLQTGLYDKTNASFLTKRHDRQFDTTVGANWHWDKNWTLNPQFNYSRNYSNIALYRYNRKDISLSIRRDFR